MKQQYLGIMNRSVYYTLCLLTVCFQVTWAAETGSGTNSFIILGPAIAPEYQGSDHYRTVPMIVSRFDIHTTGIEIEGLSAHASFFSGPKWTSGIAAELDMGRDSEVDNTAIAVMEDLDTAFNIGAFLAYEYPDLCFAGDHLEIKLSAYKDASGIHTGSYSTLGLSYAFPIQIPWRLEFELETTFADKNYMQTYFGIHSADASASGLPEYYPGNGFRDFSFTANTLFFFSPRVGLFSRLSAGKLLGDAADSPITKQGSAKQYFVGFGFFYRF